MVEPLGGLEPNKDFDKYLTEQGFWKMFRGHTKDVIAGARKLHRLRRQNQPLQFTRTLLELEHNLQTMHQAVVYWVRAKGYKPDSSTGIEFGAMSLDELPTEIKPPGQYL